MLRPFRGLLFDPERIPDVGSATSPPYDVIDSNHHDALLARSEYNVVRLILSREAEPDYKESARILDRWRSERILCLDEEPRLYLYLMEYDGPDGKRKTARGVLGAMNLEELGERVLGHEETILKHRADRMNLLTATQANLDLIIGLSSSTRLARLLIPDGEPRVDFVTPDWIRHRLYDISNKDKIQGITSAVANLPIAIADGHHRYSTALAYHQENPDVPGSDRIMAFISAAEGSGLTVGPYHRVFSGFDFSAAALSEAFNVNACEPHVPNGPGDIVLVSKEGSHLLSPKPEALRELPGPWREAGSAVAREVLYPLVGITESDATYVAEFEEAVSSVTEGGTALLLAPVTERAIAMAGEMGIRFPQKTTFFVPKPRAGLVMRTFDSET